MLIRSGSKLGRPSMSGVDGVQEAAVQRIFGNGQPINRTMDPRTRLRCLGSCAPGPLTPIGNGVLSPRWTSSATSTGEWPELTCSRLSTSPCRFWQRWTAVAPDPALTSHTNVTPLVPRSAHSLKGTTSSRARGPRDSQLVHHVR